MANLLDETTGPINEAGRDIHVIDRQLPVTISFGSTLFEIALWVTGGEVSVPCIQHIIVEHTEMSEDQLGPHQGPMGAGGNHPSIGNGGLIHIQRCAPISGREHLEESWAVARVTDGIQNTVFGQRHRCTAYRKHCTSRREDSLNTVHDR